MSVHQRPERGQKPRKTGQFLFDMIDRLNLLQKPRLKRRCPQHEPDADQSLHACNCVGEGVELLADTAKNFGDRFDGGLQTVRLTRLVCSRSTSDKTERDGKHRRSKRNERSQ